jgi:hypothetical protein
MALLWTPTRSPPEVHSRIFFLVLVAVLQILYNMFWLYYASKVHYMKIGSSLCKLIGVQVFYPNKYISDLLGCLFCLNGRFTFSIRAFTFSFRRNEKGSECVEYCWCIYSRREVHLIYAWRSPLLFWRVRCVNYFYQQVRTIFLLKFTISRCESSALFCVVVQYFFLAYCTKDRQINKMVFPTMYHPYNGVSYFPDNSEEKLNKN